ncbi:MAG: sn-glycerol-3-phosphate ABC transporter ATP-binding protein UgpC [Actinomycetota bacterium]|nr:sn-glycerol-3-phosphate ABC transporter ATP-binding protein UgpC [Actinomycetota bacterium]
MGEVVFSNVGKVYPDGTEAVRNLDADIADGELVVLVGPSGCGKTTALRMVAGLEPITRGTISIGGRIVNDVDPSDRDLAMVFQTYALYPHMTVYENIAFPLKVAKIAKEERDRRVRRIARMLGLESTLDRKPRQLSGGQRQRVAMGRAIVREPAAFLMDEPLSNLDAKLRMQMRAEVATLQAELGVTTIYVTHDQVEAMTLGHRVAVMRWGEVLQFADPETIYDHPTNLFVAAFIGSPAMNLVESELRRADDGYVVEIGSRPIRLDESETGGRDLQRYVGRKLVVGVRPEKLEDASIASSAPANRRIRGAVILREALGSDVLAHFDVEDSRELSPSVRELAHDAQDPAEVETIERDARRLNFVGRFSPASRVRAQEVVEVAIQPSGVHLFDPETGHTVG